MDITNSYQKYNRTKLSFNAICMGYVIKYITNYWFGEKMSKDCCCFHHFYISKGKRKLFFSQKRFFFHHLLGHSFWRKPSQSSPKILSTPRLTVRACGAPGGCQRPLQEVVSGVHQLHSGREVQGCWALDQRRSREDVEKLLGVVATKRAVELSWSETPGDPGCWWWTWGLWYLADYSCNNCCNMLQWWS